MNRNVLQRNKYWSRMEETSTEVEWTDIKLNWISRTNFKFYNLKEETKVKLKIEETKVKLKIHWLFNNVVVNVIQMKLELIGRWIIGLREHNE